MLDAVTSQKLIRLRTLLSAALGAASDETVTGRHISVVFLDGVVESALHLSADELGLNVQQKHGLEDVYGLVAGELGSSWNRKAWKSVRELHRARNNLQHHGILPDASHLPIWTSDVDRFVRSLTAAAFSEELSSVRSADSVAADDIREKLVGAEKAIERGEFGEAVELSMAAMAIARGRASHGRVPIHRFGITTFDEFRKIDAALNDVEEFTSVARHAADPSDWLWLKHTAGLARTQPVNGADGQRAYNFALAWILRFEAFEARLARRLPPPASNVPLDRNFSAPRIASATVQNRYDEIRITIAFADLPPLWMASLHDGLSALRRSKELPSAVWASTDRMGNLQLGLPEAADSAAIKQIIKRIIAAVHAAFEAKLSSLRTARALENSEQERFAAALSHHDEVMEVVIESATWHHGLLVKVRVDPDGVSDSAASEMKGAMQALRPESAKGHFGYEDGAFVLSVADFEPLQILPFLTEVAAEASRRGAEQSRLDAEQSDRQSRLKEAAEAACRDLIG